MTVCGNQKNWWKEAEKKKKEEKVDDFKEINMWLKVISWSKNKFLQEIYWRGYVDDKPQKQITHTHIYTLTSLLKPLMEKLCPHLPLNFGVLYFILQNICHPKLQWRWITCFKMPGTADSHRQPCATAWKAHN